MEPFLSGTSLIIHEAKLTTVDSSWSRNVFPYPYYRLYYIIGGEAVLKLKDCTIRLKKDHVYLLPAFCLVEAICRHSMSHYFIHFQTVSILHNDMFQLCKPKVEVKSNGDKTWELFQLIIKNFSNPSTYSAFICQGALQLLLAPFFREAIPIVSDRSRFSQVLNYIEKNLSRKIKIEDLSSLIGLNPVYFSNLFSEAFGIPPSQYILKKRMELAQLLLTSTNSKIKEIALETGFENEMYFSRVFRLKTGMTPGKYRGLVQSVENT